MGYSNSILGSFISVTICCIAITGVFGLYHPRAAPTPPTFPDAFNITFHEIGVKEGKVLFKNKGAWHYDYANNRARFDHGEGQINYFCDGHGLSPKDPKSGCQIFFTPTEDLIVYYPKYKTCCRVCGKEQGCTMLKPNWLQTGAKLMWTEEINGKECLGWAKPGAVAIYDTWFATSNGTPCRYHELIHNTDHNLTFVPQTYYVGPQDPALFDLPSYCNRTCPSSTTK